LSFHKKETKISSEGGKGENVNIWREKTTFFCFELTTKKVGRIFAWKIGNIFGKSVMFST